MEKEVYYAVLDEIDPDDEGYILRDGKVFKTKELAENHAKKLFIKIWRNNLNEEYYFSLIELESTSQFLKENKIKLNRKISDEELLRLYQLLKAKLENDEDSYFVQAMLSVEIVEVPINK